MAAQIPNKKPFHMASPNKLPANAAAKAELLISLTKHLHAMLSDISKGLQKNVLQSDELLAAVGADTRINDVAKAEKNLKELLDTLKLASEQMK